jgi:hypothetical protein
MSKLGSTIEVFGDVTERIRQRQKQKLINENEVKLEVMKNIKELQSQLTMVTFLDALSMMDPANPLKKEVEKFEVELGQLRTKIDTFVMKNQLDTVADIEPEEAPEEETPEPEPKEEKPPKEEEEEKIAASGEKGKVDQETNDGDDVKDDKDSKGKDAEKK